MLKPMLPTLASSLPKAGKWRYEIKYDGFRGLLEWRDDALHLWSRNGKDLLPLFPELRSFLEEIFPEAVRHFPLLLDGELVILRNSYAADFQLLQTRGRLRSSAKIEAAAATRPCHFLVFDLLEADGEALYELPYESRKEKLEALFSGLSLPLSPDHSDDCRMQLIPASSSYETTSKTVFDFTGEGMVGKKLGSKWIEGKRTDSWLKFKNWRTASCFITGMDEANHYFSVGVMEKDGIIPIGAFVSGLDQETKAALKDTIRNNATGKNGSFLEVAPGICLDLHYLERYEGELRETYFKELRFDLHPEDCTLEKFLADEALLPDSVSLTHPDKPLFEKNPLTKLEFIRYLRYVSPYLLPFLENRVLTLIRAPHGIFGESFYQKSIPETAPSFVDSFQYEDNEMIVCNRLETLIWLGNQLAIEFHIPFRTMESPFVSEIVMDLDPPSRSEFGLAIKAARLLKDLFDQLGLISFIKLSGNKGMQVYIPLPEGQFSWEDTRLFTEFAARYLLEQDPGSFTVERLKKNRGNRLYVDFIQHAEGKTIIAPYSLRNNEDGLVASPLFWEEVKDTLDPEWFTPSHVLERLGSAGDPFRLYFQAKGMQPFGQVLKAMRSY